MNNEFKLEKKHFLNLAKAGFLFWLMQTGMDWFIYQDYTNYPTYGWLVIGIAMYVYANYYY